MATKRKAARKAARKAVRKSAKRATLARTTRPVRPRALGSSAPEVQVSWEGPSGGIIARVPPDLIQRLSGILERLDGLMWTSRARVQVVCLNAISGPDSVPRLSQGQGDMVLWKNHDTVTHTLTFDGTCPLVGFPDGGVTLASGANSDAYQVRDDVDIDRFTYAIDPPITTGGSGPGEPIIIVEG